MCPGHNRGELAQQPSAERPDLRGEPSTLIVREAQASGSKLLAQDAVLFLQIVDDVTLLLVDPTGERDQDETAADATATASRSGYQGGGIIGDSVPQI